MAGIPVLKNGDTTMSITLHGTLNVQTIQGRRGPFNVTKLSTSIGIFEVKNPVLMQFAPSDYQGNFILEQIKVKAYEWAGGATPYIDAALDWAALEQFARECGFGLEEEAYSDNPVPIFDTYPEEGIEIPKFAQTVQQVEAMIGNGQQEICLGEYMLSDREALATARNLMMEAGYRFQPHAHA